jgi:hypothetical protein
VLFVCSNQGYSTVMLSSDWYNRISRPSEHVVLMPPVEEARGLGII